MIAIEAPARSTRAQRARATRLSRCASCARCATRARGGASRARDYVHETAVAWFRKRMAKERPAGLPWEESIDQWATRARRVVAAVNREYDVSGLCREFHARLEDLVTREGDRLPK